LVYFKECCSQESQKITKTSFQGNPLTQRHKILSQKLISVLEAAHYKVFVILACTVLTGLQGMKDGQTDRQMDASTIAKMREALHADAHKN